MPLHSLRHQKVLLLPERWREDGLLLLYFPEDFADRHVLYAFSMSDFYKAPAFGQAGGKRKPELMSALFASFRERGMP